jgi:acyl-CoA thioesterase-1
MGVANVHRPPTNCGPTTRGLEQIDQWLASGRWDVIHFNWGLHDLKYIADDPAALADPNDPKSHPQVPLDAYAANLERLVERLKRTGAKLIWATTTPVPQGAAGRVPGDDERYNAAARKIMEKHGVAIDDLYAFCKPRLAELQLPANVHFTPQGYQALAEQVVAAVQAALPSAEPKPPATR